MSYYEKILQLKREGEYYLQNGDYNKAKIKLSEALKYLKILYAKSDKPLKKLWKERINEIEKIITKIDQMQSRSEEEKEHKIKKVLIGKGFSYILKEIEKAESIIRICTPWFSLRVAEKIIKAVLANEVPTYILVKPISPDFNPNQTAAYYFLIENAKRYDSIIFLRGVPNLHAKMLIIDQRLYISGSFNLTTSGLRENIELINISSDPEEIEEAIREFDNLWYNYSIPLF
ncbi:MAG: phospholipase D family protein [Candidatus Asgardarchaeum sp.]